MARMVSTGIEMKVIDWSEHGVKLMVGVAGAKEQATGDGISPEFEDARLQVPQNVDEQSFTRYLWIIDSFLLPTSRRCPAVGTGPQISQN